MRMKGKVEKEVRFEARDYDGKENKNKINLVMYYPNETSQRYYFYFYYSDHKIVIFDENEINVDSITKHSIEKTMNHIDNVALFVLDNGKGSFELWAKEFDSVLKHTHHYPIRWAKVELFECIELCEG